jgi:hypothetical protein
MQNATDLMNDFTSSMGPFITESPPDPDTSALATRSILEALWEPLCDDTAAISYGLAAAANYLSANAQAQFMEAQNASRNAFKVVSIYFNEEIRTLTWEIEVLWQRYLDLLSYSHWRMRPGIFSTSRDAFILRDMWTRIDEAGSNPYMGLNHPVKYASLRRVLDMWTYVPGSTERSDRSFGVVLGVTVYCLMRIRCFLIWYVTFPPRVGFD